MHFTANPTGIMVTVTETKHELTYLKIWNFIGKSNKARTFSGFPALRLNS
jgi:hypothetical protein